MDFAFSPADESYRQQVRQWLVEHHPGPPPGPHGSAAWLQWARGWQRRAYEAGYVGLGWPQQYGGVAGSLTQQVILTQELVRARAPQFVGQMGLRMLGPTLLHYGSAAQRQRYLPRILRAEEIWCQGYSEPNAGSDLASLQTQAVEDGDDFVVNGQKIWTSGAHYADFCFLLVRTDPHAPKHRGISYLLVDLRSPGITVKPLQQMTGTAHFNETFFENVRVPKENLVGELNRGWYYATTTLSYERTLLANSARTELFFEDMLALARRNTSQGLPAAKQAVMRQTIAQLKIETEIAKLLFYRNLTTELRGGIPGPEASIMKLYSTELNHRICDTALHLMGPYASLWQDSKYVVDDGMWQYEHMYTRGLIIGGGTSQIQKNIMGERALGLPK
jgi:alkylation response protein AidB-like acyl-CoA dehydrogenase